MDFADCQPPKTYQDTFHTPVSGRGRHVQRVRVSPGTWRCLLHPRNRKLILAWHKAFPTQILTEDCAKQPFQAIIKQLSNDYQIKSLQIVGAERDDYVNGPE